ncbi:MAG: diguanylate cyclase [Hyphomicrobiales bacterium]
MAILLSPQTQIFNLRIADFLQLMERTPVSQDILIVDIDRKTIDKSGSFPVSNQFYAKLLNHLEGAGTQRIYLDRLLSVKTNAADDQALADALAKLGPEKIGIPAYNPTPTQALSKPNEKFAGTTTVLGSSFFPDTDNRYRKFSTYAGNGAVYPNAARWLNGETSFRPIALNQHFDLESLTHISAWDVLSLPASELANKTILIGIPTSVTSDGLTYTNNSKINRVTLVALAYESVRTQTDTKAFSRFWEFIILLGIGLFSISLSIALDVTKNKRVGRVVYALFGIFSIFYVSYYLLSTHYLYLPIVSMVFAFGLAKLVFSAFKIRLLEMIFELYSGDLSPEEAWAWQTVARQKEPLVLIGFKGPKRWNDAAKQAGFFDEDNPNTDKNKVTIQTALNEKNNEGFTVDLHDLHEVKTVECSFPFAHIPLIRIEDITAEQNEKKRLEKALHTDPLTGCLNRAGFFAAVGEVESNYATIMMDLNGFKTANDTLGHAAGDELLKIAARQFANVLSDDQTLGRLGGDEFCVMLPTVETPEAAQHVCDLLENAFKGKIDLSGGLQAEMSVAAGFAIAKDGNKIDYVLDQADQQMYKRKAQIKAVPKTAPHDNHFRTRTP